MNADPTKTWEAKSLPHPRQLLGLKVSPCGTFAVAGDFDGRLQRWNLADDQKTTLEHHQTWVQALVFHPDRRRLFSTDYWGNLACWPYADATPRPTWTVTGGHQGWIRAAVVSPDGRHLATAGNDLAVRLWDCDTGRSTRTLTGHDAHIFSLAFHPNGRDLVSGDQVGVLKHWDATAGRHVRDLDARALWHSPEATKSLTGIGGVRALAFNRAGTELVCGGLTEPTSPNFAAGKPHALTLDWTRGTLKRTLKFKEPFEGYVVDLTFHPDGYLVGGGGGVGGALWFWRPDQDEPFHTVKGLRHVRELALHPDNLRLVAASFEPRGQGGNGRGRANRDDYVDNVGVVKIYAMTQRPATAPARRR